MPLAPRPLPIWEENGVVSCGPFVGLLFFWPFCYLSLFTEHGLVATAPLSVASSARQNEESETWTNSTTTWEGLT